MAVVFVSADQDEHAFRDYHLHQPWHALPYADRGRVHVQSKICVPLFAARTLNAVGQYRVTLSLHYRST